MRTFRALLKAVSIILVVVSIALAFAYFEGSLIPNMPPPDVLPATNES